MEASIFRVIVPVDGIQQGVDFYAALFGTPGERVSGGRHYFQCGPVVLALVDPASERQPFRPNPDWLYLAGDARGARRCKSGAVLWVEWQRHIIRHAHSPSRERRDLEAPSANTARAPAPWRRRPR